MSNAMMSRRTLAVIGAGPKGIAVAVKAKVLAEFGYPVDRVILIERHGVGAHWSGNFGYTNGEMKLGTSPEKDVVYPLLTDLGNAGTNARLRERLMHFSWVSFLVQTETYADWIDRGRPAPCHQWWAKYLQWVAGQLGPEIEIVNAEVSAIDVASDGEAWILRLGPPGGATRELTVDRLMMTGPGEARANFAGDALEHEAVDRLETFWSALKSGTFPTKGKIAVVGSGENAASILLALREIDPSLHVDVIASRGFLSSRGESFYENQFYSDPERHGWRTLAEEDRRDFVERTDLGVFSQHAMDVLAERRRHRVIPGRVTALNATRSANAENSNGVTLTVEAGSSHSSHDYDRVILATGSDQAETIRRLFTRAAQQRVSDAIGGSIDRTRLSERIGPDLAVQELRPNLHLPMLAGLAQGPGFANLSCLGLLADRILVSR